MTIKIIDKDFTEIWDGVFYKKLSNYPEISDWELRTIIEFIEYENKYNRTCKIECEDKNLLDKINKEISNPEKYKFIPRPKLITECTACPNIKGCDTEFVCHTTSLDNAKKILFVFQIIDDQQLSLKEKSKLIYCYQFYLSNNE